jgi:hypothetical protein
MSAPSAASSVASAAATAHRAYVLSLYRELLALLKRLPDPSEAAARREEARRAVRERATACAPDSADAQQHAKELAARVSFLRITAPRPPGAPLGPARGSAGAAGGGGGGGDSGKTTYVLREGRLVPVGGGEEAAADDDGAAAATKGRRVADGSISREEAFRRNAEHYKRFTGKEWRRNSLFF